MKQGRGAANTLEARALHALSLSTSACALRSSARMTQGEGAGMQGWGEGAGVQGVMRGGILLPSKRHVPLPCVPKRWQQPRQHQA